MRILPKGIKLEGREDEGLREQALSFFTILLHHGVFVLFPRAARKSNGNAGGSKVPSGPEQDPEVHCAAFETKSAA
ncbi:MAG: hypothetical protein D6679_08995 [Candidatus Hydrogenedentota bacterium]|nr:MAG: hypothetical protein D6679_08995 [Candidatus Hydrogenedentota bacterium]